MVVVADVLAQSGLTLEAVQLPRPEAEVRWVATSELVDPTPYLEGGEVLLTTGLDTKGWRSEWRGYVERLADAGVVALGFAVGLTHQRAPTLLARACADFGLNLFEVPRPTAFVAISRAIADLLEAEREHAAQRSTDAQRVLTRAALEVDDAGAVVRELAVIVQGAAMTVTRDGVQVAGPHGPRADDIELDEVRNEVERIRGQGLRASASSVRASGTTVVRPLGVRSRPETWLAVFVPGRVGDVERVAITTAASLLGLHLERARERRTTDRGLRARALELLLADDDRTARIVLGAASGAAGDGPRLPREIRVLRARGSEEALDDALPLFEDGHRLAAVMDGELIVVTSARGAFGTAQQLADHGLQVGVGRSVPADEGSVSHASAGHALAGTGRAASIRVWDDLAGSGVVGVLGADRAAAFARSFLAPLDGDPVLIETLGAFLRNHGSRGDTAAELGVHRNTVRNRLEQIEALLGASFDDPRTRVDAWIALQGMAAATG